MKFLTQMDRGNLFCPHYEDAITKWQQGEKYLGRRRNSQLEETKINTFVDRTLLEYELHSMWICDLCETVNSLDNPKCSTEACVGEHPTNNRLHLLKIRMLPKLADYDPVTDMETIPCPICQTKMVSGIRCLSCDYIHPSLVLMDMFCECAAVKYVVKNGMCLQMPCMHRNPIYRTKCISCSNFLSNALLCTPDEEALFNYVKSLDDVTLRYMIATLRYAYSSRDTYKSYRHFAWGCFMCQTYNEFCFRTCKRCHYNPSARDSLYKDRPGLYTVPKCSACSVNDSMYWCNTCVTNVFCNSCFKKNGDRCLCKRPLDYILSRTQDNPYLEAYNRQFQDGEVVVPNEAINQYMLNMENMMKGGLLVSEVMDSSEGNYSEDTPFLPILIQHPEDMSVYDQDSSCSSNDPVTYME